MTFKGSLSLPDRFRDQGRPQDFFEVRFLNVCESFLLEVCNGPRLPENLCAFRTYTLTS